MIIDIYLIDWLNDWMSSFPMRRRKNETWAPSAAHWIAGNGRDSAALYFIFFWLLLVLVLIRCWIMAFRVERWRPHRPPGVPARCARFPLGEPVLTASDPRGAAVARHFHLIYFISFCWKMDSNWWNWWSVRAQVKSIKFHILSTWFQRQMTISGHVIPLPFTCQLAFLTPPSLLASLPPSFLHVPSPQKKIVVNRNLFIFLCVYCRVTAPRGSHFHIFRRGRSEYLSVTSNTGFENALKIAPKLLRNCSEIALKLLWNCSEIALKLLRNCSEIAPKSLWNRSEIALKLLWNRSEIALKSLWNRSEIGAVICRMGERGDCSIRSGTALKRPL